MVSTLSRGEGSVDQLAVRDRGVELHSLAFEFSEQLATERCDGLLRLGRPAATSIVVADFDAPAVAGVELRRVHDTQSRGTASQGSRGSFPRASHDGCFERLRKPQNSRWMWSGWEDSNSRPPAPKSDERGYRCVPDCTGSCRNVSI